MSTSTKAVSNTSIAEKRSFDANHFKPFAAPRRKAGLRDDQIAVSKHSIAMPVSVATKLGEKVALFWSDADKAIAIQKAADGDYKLCQIGKNKTSKTGYCKMFIEAKKVKTGRYITSFDDKNQMLIARLA